jgi:hypothetical protein
VFLWEIHLLFIAQAPYRVKYDNKATELSLNFIHHDNCFRSFVIDHFLRVENFLEERMENNEEKVEFPARYDYDSIDIHDGSWWVPLNTFLYSALLSHSRWEQSVALKVSGWGRKLWERETHAYKKSSRLKIDFPVRFSLLLFFFFLLAFFQVDEIKYWQASPRMCLFASRNFSPRFVPAITWDEKWKFSHANKFSFNEKIEEI